LLDVTSSTISLRINLEQTILPDDILVDVRLRHCAILRAALFLCFQNVNVVVTEVDIVVFGNTFIYDAVIGLEVGPQ